MFLTKLIILACIGSLIGWITNRLAVKFLFKPVRPVKLPFGASFQGVIPRRKEEMARVMGEVVERELVSTKELIEKIISDDELDGIKEQLTKKLIEIAQNKIPPMILRVAGNPISTIISNYMDKEGKKILKDFISSASDKAKEKVNISKIVEEKINGLNFGQFEDIVIEIIKKELNHIEIMGAVLGFIIGALQGLVVLLIK